MSTTRFSLRPLISGVIGAAALACQTAVQDGVDPPPAVASVGIVPNATSVIVGASMPLVATPYDAAGNPLAGRTIAWTSDNSAVASVSANGMVRGETVGNTTIRATSEGRTGVAQVTVAAVPPAPVASVTVAPTSASLVVGNTTQLTATPYDAQGDPLLGRAITWSSDAPAIASVSASGLVRAEAVGSATIRATSEGVAGTSQITVSAVPPPPVASVTVSPSPASVVDGATLQLTATAFDAQGNPLAGRAITWTSDNGAVASVSGSGLVRGESPGMTTVRATSEGRTGASQVTVTAAPPPPVATVTIAPASASVVDGNTVQLVATARDAQGNTLTGRTIGWSSDHVAIASVTGAGLVRGESPGATTIRAISEGQTGTAQITVTALPPPPVSTVTVTPSTASVVDGNTAQLSATTRDAQGNVLTGRVVTWSSDNTAIATVSGTGLVRGEAAGTTTVRATSEGQTGTSQITVTGNPTANFALRFFANVLNDVGRVKIPLENRAVNVGATHFTIEFWVRGRLQDNTEGSAACGAFVDAWIEGNILLDRDRFSRPRDYGLAFLAGRIAFGIRTDQDQAYTVCGSRNVLDDQWHHVAVTRNVSSGALAIYVDGFLDASASGPSGDVSYPAGFSCPGGCGADPYLVLGAEKHDVGLQYPGFNGLLDELRLSTSIRYSGPFAPPSARFVVDAQTAALYHFDEGSGAVAADAVGASPGEVRVGGSPPGPAWVASTAPTGD